MYGCLQSNMSELTSKVIGFLVGNMSSSNISSAYSPAHRLNVASTI